uniref:peptidyl-tRNA hydrolase n=1 Tax=Cucumis melo TaxID=3656 RepID=A0A9I9CH65_CUCME
MLGASKSSRKKQQVKPEKEWLSVSFKPENFIPGLVIGFILGLFLDLSKPSKGNAKKGYFLPSKYQQLSPASNNGDQELKLVLVVRQDLKMGSGKIASQCAHAATGLYAELMQRNKLKDAAENIGLPTFVVADAGRTQVSAGSKTVLAIGPGNASLPYDRIPRLPGPKEAIDAVTGKLRLL